MAKVLDVITQINVLRLQLQATLLPRLATRLCKFALQVPNRFVVRTFIIPVKCDGECEYDNQCLATEASKRLYCIRLAQLSAPQALLMWFVTNVFEPVKCGDQSRM